LEKGNQEVKTLGSYPISMQNALNHQHVALLKRGREGWLDDREGLW